MDIAEVSTVILQYGKLRDEVDRIFEEYKKVFKPSNIRMNLESFYTNEDELILTIAESWAYGGYDTVYVRLPLFVLWTTNVKAVFVKMQEEHEEKRIQREAIRTQEQQDADLRMYESIKKQYDLD